MAHHTAWLSGARGNCGDFTGEWFSIIGWNFGLIRSVFQKLLKVQVGSVIYTQKYIKVHYEKRRPATGLRGLCLNHDNAPAHKCVLVQDSLKEKKVVQLSHPPYSPDLSPCDFFLFPLLKKTLSGRRYESQSALGSAIHQCLQDIPKKAYFSAFTEWISRLEKCVSVKGE